MLLWINLWHVVVSDFRSCRSGHLFGKLKQLLQKQLIGIKFLQVIKVVKLVLAVGVVRGAWVVRVFRMIRMVHMDEY